MKLTSIQTSNFLGARAVDVALAKPIGLFAGKNGAGKSSLRDAIALAFTADLGRVSLKKDAPELISDDAEAAVVEIGVGGDTYAIAINRSGRISDSRAGKENPAALPFVLDAQCFAALDDKGRREFLFGLMGLKADGKAVTQRLIKRGCDEKKVELVAPMLRAGFDAAHKEAAAKARDAKACWKAATGGETWGKDKAATWAPESLTVAADKAASLAKNAAEKVAEIDGQISELNQQIGSARQAAQEVANATAKREELTAKAGRVQRIKEKIDRDTAERDEWRTKVADCRARAGEQPDPRNPGQFLLRGLAAVTRDFLDLSSEFPEVQWPAELLNRAAINLVEYRKLHGEPTDASQPAPEAVANLPNWEQALSLMESAVRNGERDLVEAQLAASELAKLGDAAQPGGGDVSALQAQLDELKTSRTGWQADAEKYRRLVDAHKTRQKSIDDAAKHHADVIAWDAIAQAFAPDGIPGDLLAEALGPINTRLQAAAADTEWEQVVIHPDMRITYGGRAYHLISESEKWRVGAMIAEAISHLSGLKLLVLDRFDVLEPGKGREDLIIWLDILAQDGEIDSALIFGTLKALPGVLPDTIQAIWIENGTAGQLKEAA